MLFDWDEKFLIVLRGITSIFFVAHGAGFDSGAFIGGFLLGFCDSFRDFRPINLQYVLHWWRARNWSIKEMEQFPLNPLYLKENTQDIRYITDWPCQWYPILHRYHWSTFGLSFIHSTSIWHEGAYCVLFQNYNLSWQTCYFTLENKVVNLCNFIIAPIGK